MFKQINSALMAAATLVTLANCSANKALDATQSMPDKIDATNSEVKKTNAGMTTMVGEVKKTNSNMDTMVGEVKKTNAGMTTMVGEVKKTNSNMDTMVGEVKKTNAGMDTMVGEVKKTNSNMDTMVGEVKKTNEGMAKTNLAVHRQTLSVALADMLREDNTRFLAPPVNMMPGGAIFSAEATADELMQLIYVNLNFVEKTPPMPEDAANPDSFNKAKVVRLTAAGVLAGLAPQATIDEIIKSQIENSGPFEQAAVGVLMLRYDFISSWIVRPKIGAGLTNPGMIAEVVQYTEALSAIANLPYAERIELPITGLIGDDPLASPGDDGKKPALNARYSKKLNPKQVVVLWKKINSAIDGLDAKYTDPNSKSAQLISKLREQVKSHLPTDAAPAAVVTDAK